MSNFESFCDNLLETKQVTYTTTYVGFDTTKTAGMFHWKVSINGETFDFWRGEAYVNEPGKVRLPEYGYREPSVDWKRDNSLYGVDFRKAWYATPGAAKPPKLADVLYSLVSDFDASQMDFEGFCSEYSYSTDSRSAEQTHQACCDNGRRFVKSVGLVLAASICEASRDY